MSKGVARDLLDDFGEDEEDAGNLAEFSPRVVPLVGEAGTRGHERIVCLLASQGYDDDEVAGKAKVSVATVRKILTSERGKATVAEMLADASELDSTEAFARLLKGGAAAAIMELRQLATGAQSESVRRQAASAILDRVFKKDDLQSGSNKTPADLLASIYKTKDSNETEF